MIQGMSMASTAEGKKVRGIIIIKVIVNMVSKEASLATAEPAGIVTHYYYNSDT